MINATFYVNKKEKNYCVNPYCRCCFLRNVYVTLKLHKRNTIENIKWCNKCHLYYISPEKRDRLFDTCSVIDGFGNYINKTSYHVERENSIKVIEIKKKTKKEKKEKKEKSERKVVEAKILNDLLNKNQQDNEIQDIRNRILEPVNQIKISNTPIEERKITARDFVIRCNVFRCRSEMHRLEDITAVVTVIDKDGKELTKKVSTGYCVTCGVYFMMESVYASLKRQGVVLCRVSDAKNYYKNNNANSMNLANESVLKQFGYNVSRDGGLKETERQKNLAVLIDKKVLTKSEIISYLDFFINRCKYQEKYYIAIGKWEADRDFVANYKLGSYENYGVIGLHR